MTTIYLVRHGEYENPHYRFPGRLPGYPLSETGKAQVNRLARSLSAIPFASVYSSPLLRTSQTADLLAGMAGSEVTYRDCLLEVRTNLDGESMLRFDETAGELPYFPEHHARGAESVPELAARVHGCLEAIREANEGKNVLVVTHGDAIRFGLVRYLGLPLTFAEGRKIATPLAGGYRLEFEAGTVSYYPIVVS